MSFTSSNLNHVSKVDQAREVQLGHGAEISSESLQFLSELTEVLKIFKYDMNDTEVESVEQFIAKIMKMSSAESTQSDNLIMNGEASLKTSSVVELDSDQLKSLMNCCSMIKTALYYAVDSQSESTLVGFLKLFSAGGLSIDKTTHAIQNWYSQEISKM